MEHILHPTARLHPTQQNHVQYYSKRSRCHHWGFFGFVTHLDFSLSCLAAGIGEATARVLANEEYPLLLLSRRLERMEELRLPNTMCRQVDVTDAEALKKAVAEAEAKYGPVFALVSNAGIMLLGDPATQDVAEWRKMIDVTPPV